jgi:hypothetical protein
MSLAYAKTVLSIEFDSNEDMIEYLTLAKKEQVKFKAKPVSAGGELGAIEFVGPFVVIMQMAENVYYGEDARGFIEEISYDAYKKYKSENIQTVVEKAV